MPSEVILNEMILKINWTYEVEKLGKDILLSRSELCMGIERQKCVRSTWKGKCCRSTGNMNGISIVSLEKDSTTHDIGVIGIKMSRYFTYYWEGTKPPIN